MTVDVAQPAEHPLVAEQGPGALPTRYEDDVRSVHVIDRVVGEQAEGIAVRPYRPGLETGELHLPARHRPHHLVGPDRVEHGQLVENEDRDLHGR